MTHNNNIIKIKGLCETKTLDTYNRNTKKKYLFRDTIRLPVFTASSTYRPVAIHC